MAIKTYRNANNGKVGSYPDTLARHFSFLVEVKPDAKPLAYTPIPGEAIERVVASRPEKKAK